MRSGLQRSLNRSLHRAMDFPSALFGGVVNPLDSIANVKSWVADAAKVTLSGSDVTAWAEKYVGAANFSFASARPTWSDSGGPTGGGAITKPVGRNLLYGSAPIAGSPYSVYAVVKTPTITANTPLIFTGTRSGATGFRYSSTTDSYFYTGETPYYSTTMYDVQRTGWMLLVIRVADSNSFWIEINDEPVSFRILDSAGTTQTTILDFGTKYDGIQIAEINLIPSVLDATTNSAVKQYLVNKYGLTMPTKKVMLFGDSHADGTQSGTPVGSPFRTNLLADEAGLSLQKLSANGACAVNNNGSGDFIDYAATYARSKWSSYKVILCYGTNDCATASGGYGWTSWANWKASYKAEIQRFITAGWNPADICIMTPPYSTGAYVAGNLTTVKDLIKEIASELGLTLVDWWQLCVDASHNVAALGGDNIHGNNTTHGLVRTALSNFI